MKIVAITLVALSVTLLIAFGEIPQAPSTIPMTLRECS